MKAIKLNQNKIDNANNKLNALAPGVYTFQELVDSCAGDLAWQPFSKVLSSHPKVLIEILGITRKYTKLGE